MTINAYDIGDLVRCRGEFKDINDALIDPAAVFFKAKSPLGTITELAYGGSPSTLLIRESAGVYYVDVSADVRGKYKWRLYSTGNGQAAAEGEFLVRNSALL